MPLEELGVWLRFDAPDDEDAAHEGNAYRTADGVRFDYCHTGVGLISSRHFNTYAELSEALEREGWQDFSS